MKSHAVASLKVLALAALLGLAANNGANAQDQFAEPKLEAFVVAAISVQERFKRWTSRIQAAESKEAADRLRAEANADLFATIENAEGITLEEYRTINGTARTDPALSARIDEIYRAKVAQ